MTGNELGNLGELHVMRLLSSAGASVRFGGVSDLVAQGVNVEVKAARQRVYTQGKRGYRFCLCSPWTHSGRWAGFYGNWSVMADSIEGVK